VLKTKMSVVKEVTDQNMNFIKISTNPAHCKYSKIIKMHCSY